MLSEVAGRNVSSACCGEFLSSLYSVFDPFTLADNIAGSQRFALLWSTSVAVLWNAFFTFLASGASSTQVPNATPSPALTSYRPIFTVPPDADRGALLIPNIKDPVAVDAQRACPGYLASNVQNTQLGLTATLALAGNACNVYGTDVGILNLTVEYQSRDRLSVNIVPAYVDSFNRSHFLLSERLVPKPAADQDAHLKIHENDLIFDWSNEPTFSFKVSRESTGDILFSTEGSVLVFENQFIEFVTSLPQNYHLYGLGERIHGLRLGNNFTTTTYTVDVGSPVDT
jgi:alpha-glucosidase